MDLPIELVGLLKHAGVDGKKLSWDLQVNSSAISIKLMWIKAAKPVEKTGKKYLSPSTRRRNAQRMEQLKAKREALVTTKLVFKHRETTSTPLQMKRRKQSSSTVTPKPSAFQQY
jgi:predicted transcriptional regulator